MTDVTRNEAQTHQWLEIDGDLIGWFADESGGPGLTDFLTALTAAGDEGSLDLDLRLAGARVRVRGDQAISRAERVAEAALAAGLRPHPDGVLLVDVQVEATDPGAVAAIWNAEFAGVQVGDPAGSEVQVSDPLRRVASAWVSQLAEPRPLRNRLHLDLSRPTSREQMIADAEAVGAQTGVAPWATADVDGNEADLIGGESLSGEVSDWVGMFTGAVGYRLQSRPEALRFAAAALDVAREADWHLGVDVRDALVVVDTGKDRWESDGFAAVGARVQQLAHEAGASVENDDLRFVQACWDAHDVASSRAFWAAVLDVEPVADERLTDLLDPLWFAPPLVIQRIDEPDEARSQQRNRTRLRATVSAERAERMVSAAIAHGGRLLDEANRRILSDPENNELELVVVPAR